MSSHPDLGPQPQLGYVDSILDRAAEKRDDKDFLAGLARRPDCAVHVIGGEMIVLKKNGREFISLFSPDEAAGLGTVMETLFLGLDRGGGRFGYGLEATSVEALKSRDDLHVTDLRTIAVQGLVQAEELAPLAEAKALLHWHARHRHCAVCGARTNVANAGWRRECPACKAEHFPRTDPVVIMLAIRGDKCLLGRQTRFVQNSWSCLAGFIEPGESIEEAARRETFEEAGIRCGRVRYFRSQPWPFPSSLMIGCHAEALNEDIVVDTNELEAARWFDRGEAAAMLARTHPQGLITPPPVAIAHHIIRAWVEKGGGVFG
ncbi:MAG TPA: NAD(+) diphosphatase [Pseudorhodoplanes sp.]|jgi:NAD+ diphosphatase|nr:NAD(+) diphosphatase [Pseudorhodoplanes sp.]